MGSWQNSICSINPSFKLIALLFLIYLLAASIMQWSGIHNIQAEIDGEDYTGGNSYFSGGV
jgi:uncharacterized membrane protein